MRQYSKWRISGCAAEKGECVVYSLAGLVCEIAKRHPKVPFSQTEPVAYQAAAFSCTAAAFL
jgi:hypothetical protein